MQRIGEIKAIKKIANELDNYEIGNFDADKNFHHIFNLFALYSQSNFKILKSQLDKLTTDHLANRSIELSEMTSWIQKALRDSQDDFIRIDNYPVIVARTIRGKFNNQRPPNFFPMLTYDGIKGYLDRLSQSKRLPNLMEIKSKLSEPLRLISNYRVHI